MCCWYLLFNCCKLQPVFAFLLRIPIMIFLLSLSEISAMLWFFLLCYAVALANQFNVKNQTFNQNCKREVFFLKKIIWNEKRFIIRFFFFFYVKMWIIKMLVEQFLLLKKKRKKTLGIIFLFCTKCLESLALNREKFVCLVFTPFRCVCAQTFNRTQLVLKCQVDIFTNTHKHIFVNKILFWMFVLECVTSVVVSVLFIM